MRPTLSRWMVVLLFLVTAPATGVGALTVEDGEVYGHGEHADDERAFHELVDEERVAAGLQPLTVFSDLVEGARAHSEVMAETSVLHHNPDLVSVTDAENWWSLGENVGRGLTVEGLHTAFMNSPAHSDNVLHESYNYLGVGVTVGEDGRMWVTMVFMHGPADVTDSIPLKSPEPSPASDVPIFGDIAGTTHEAAIVALAEAGITAGCGASGVLFCPGDDVTRAQMAAFLDRALDLPAADQDWFTDDTGSIHEDSINRLAHAGVTLGCEIDRFCPEEPISREQMASFLARALDLGEVTSDWFTDDAASPHQASINAVAEQGITLGCGEAVFCPQDRVTRAQMAGFLARALGLV